MIDARDSHSFGSFGIVPFMQERVNNLRRWHVLRLCFEALYRHVLMSCTAREALRSHVLRPCTANGEWSQVLRPCTANILGGNGSFVIVPFTDEPVNHLRRWHVLRPEAAPVLALRPTI